MENAYASDPGLWRKNFTDCYEQKHTRVITLNDITEQTFPAYCRLLEENGFVVQEARGRYAAYQKEGMGVFLNDWGSSLRIVLEENCNYFSFQSPAARADLSPQITQIHLEDFGMSYAIRLSDGRFILIDGGRDFPPDADELFRCLKEGSLHSVPIIAAWIMSHPHSDHVPCFGTFMERYGAQVIIEKILYNFPQAAKFVPPDKPKEEKTLSENVDKDTVEPFEALVKELGIPVYTPHTGQIYPIGDALCEILSSLDDTIHCATNINATSLVIRMELGGQVILWATDASFSHAHLAERYGTYLKADILQVPHHGFGSGTHEAQIQCFDLIRPATCLLPVSEYNAYNVFCAYREGTNHLMTNVDVQEMITGDTTRTLTLPYTPLSYGAKTLQRLYEEGQNSAGAKNWFFTELNTANGEDFVYTLLNTTHAKAQITVELFFENKKQAIRHIKTIIPPMIFRAFSVIDPEEVESESVYYNPWSLATRGIPENAPFALRIMSSIPIVVSHKTHAPAYYK